MSQPLFSSRDNALARAKNAAEKDPLPDVPMALLSAADIERYARSAAILHPFYMDNLKSSSYEIHAGGRFIYWQRDGDRIDKIEKLVDRNGANRRIILLANSISYIQTEAEFLLPPYIAVRFNLRISHVHRGLLLGTGPLVDPGFCGRLLIPLHNLTAEDYELDLEQALIWVEFTKTSYVKDRPGELAFPEDKKWLEPKDYFEKANRNRPILSSILEAIKGTEQIATRADDRSKMAEAKVNTVWSYAWPAVIGLGVAIVAILVSLGSVIIGSWNLSNGVRNELSGLVFDSKDHARSMGFHPAF